MKGRRFLYFVLCVALAVLPLAGCSSGGGGSVGSVTTGEKGTALTVNGSVDAGSSSGKTVGLFAAPDIGDVWVLNAADASILNPGGTPAPVKADGSFSISFNLPAPKTVLVFKASVPSKSATPFYSVVPIDLSNPPAVGIGGSQPIVIAISQTSSNVASTISSALGLAGALGETGNAIPAGSDYTTVAQLALKYGGQVLAYNTVGNLVLAGTMNESLLPAQDANTLTGDELNNMTLDGRVTGVSIPGKNPIVSFEVTNAVTKKGIRGLKSFGLAIAQLKPEDATTGAPSEWLSYMIASSTSRPSTDSGYTVLDNGDGSYTVKFARDVKAVTSVPYDNTRTHRVAVQVRTAPAAALTTTGTSVTNFRNEKIMFYDFIPATPTVAPTVNRNIVKTEACVACHTKLGVTTPHGGRGDVRYCMMCHNSQRGNGQAAVASTAGAFPALTKTVSVTGSVSYSPSTYVADGEVAGEFVTMIHKIHMGEELTKQNYNYASVLFNEVIYPMPVTNCTSCHIEDTATLPQALNWKDKPSRKACGACHDNINWATGANLKAGGLAHTYHIGANPDTTCVGCHGSASPQYAAKVHIPVVPPDPNNIFLNTMQSTTTGYVAGTSVTGNNNTNASWLVGSQTNLPVGANRISYEIGSVTLNASSQPVITFKFKKNGTDVVFNTYAAGVKEEMMDGYVGSPSAYFVWAVPQDGITAPADYNASTSVYIKNFWRGDGKDAKGVALSSTSAKGTMTGPDGSGFYTIAINNITIPASAVMLTGGIGYTYGLGTTLPLTQIDLAAYPYTPNSGRTDPYTQNSTTYPNNGLVNSGYFGIGGLSVPAPNVWKVATGFTGRRIIVDNAKCNACHNQLGVGPTYHAGQRNDAPTCTFCHTVNRTNSGWPVNINYDVHALHGASARANKFSWEVSAGAEFWNVAYPGILNNCDGCHITYNGSTSGPLAGAAGTATYNFTAAPRVTPATGSAGNVPVYTDALLSSLLMTTAASGTMPATVNSIITGSETVPGTYYSPFVTASAAYGSAFGYAPTTGVTTAAAGTTLVLSPISAACSGCHDSKTARAHMQANGGTVFGPRTTALASTEQCLVCHGVGKLADIKAVHAWR